MISVGMRITTPSPQLGFITTNGRDVTSPIRISEVGWFCLKFAVLPRMRNGIPTHSLRTNSQIVGFIDASKSSSTT